MIVDAGQHLLPAALETFRTKRALEKPALPHMAPRPPWLLFDVATEFRAIYAMLFDRRFQFTWAGRLVPLAALVLIILSYWTVGSIPFVGGILDRLVNVALIVIAYKVLSREARRYRELVAVAGPMRN